MIKIIASKYISILTSVTGLILHVSIICVITYFVRLEVASISADCPEWSLIIKIRLIILGADSGFLFSKCLKSGAYIYVIVQMHYITVGIDKIDNFATNY